jgi:phosphatidylglycerol:prolipoprotein diacylglycerol transferase
MFSLIFGIGATAGLALTTWQSPPEARHRIADVGLLVILGGLVGSRLMFTILNWSYYQNHLEEILLIYLGGLAWPGFLLGGFLVLAGYVAWNSESLRVYADNMFPLVVSLVVAAWMACWLDGCAYGHTSTTWWAVPTRDEGGLLTLRFPLQLLGALLALCTLWILDANRERFVLPGMLAASGGFFLTLEYLTLSFWRVDPTPIWLGLRLDTWTAFILLAVIGLPLGFLIIRQAKTGRMV